MSKVHKKLAVVQETSHKVAELADAETTPRKGLLIVGMHRSGTSLLSAIMSQLGATPPKSLIPPSESNESGYWESARLCNLHDQFLGSIQSRWNDILPLTEDLFKSPQAQDFVTIIEEAVQTEFEDSKFFCIKDPRIARLLPLWLAAFARMEVEPLVLFPFRNPLEVAASLKKRNGISLSKSQILWLRHVLEAEQFSRAYPRSFLAYDDLLSDWRGIVAKVGNDLAIEWPHLSPTVVARVDELVSWEKRHHVVLHTEIHAHPALSIWVKEAYRELGRATAGHEEKLPGVVDRIALQIQAADRAYGPIVASLELETNELRERETRIRGDLDAKNRSLEDLDAFRDEVEKLRSDLDTAQQARDQLMVKIDRLGQEAKQNEEDRTEAECAQAAAEAVLYEQRARIDLLSQRTSVLHDAIAEDKAALEKERGRFREAVELRIQAEKSLAHERGRLDQQSEFIARLEQELVVSRTAQSNNERVKERRRWLAPLRLLRYLTGRYSAERRRLRRHVAQITESGIFDTEWYLAQYPDVAEAGTDPVVHYLCFGASEGRDPSPLFDTDWYLTQYPDVARAGINPLVHYLCSGASEGRDPNRGASAGKE